MFCSFNLSDLLSLTPPSYVTLWLRFPTNFGETFGQMVLFLAVCAPHVYDSFTWLLLGKNTRSHLGVCCISNFINITTYLSLNKILKFKSSYIIKSQLSISITIPFNKHLYKEKKPFQRNHVDNIVSNRIYDIIWQFGKSFYKE